MYTCRPLRWQCSQKAKMFISTRVHYAVKIRQSGGFHFPSAESSVDALHVLELSGPIGLKRDSKGPVSFASETCNLGDLTQ